MTKTILRHRLTLAASTLLALLVASTALAAVPGDPFSLGVTNTIDNALTTLTGTRTGALLQVTNTSTASSAKALAATGKSPSGATIQAHNSGGGPALSLLVNDGKSPMTVSAGAGKVTNLDADKLDGKSAGEFVQGFAVICGEGLYIREIIVNLNGSNSSTCGQDRDSAHYKRTVVISPGGTAVQNGTALRNALNAISSASDTNRFLLKLEPGVYDLGTSDLVMKPFIDIEGSGELATKITGRTGEAGTTGGNSGTVVASPTVELRSLTVENTGGGQAFSVAVYISGGAPRLTHVTAKASGGSSNNIGVRTKTGSSVIMQNVTATATGGLDSVGVLNETAFSKMNEVFAEAIGRSATTRATGVSNNGSSLPRMRNVRIEVRGADLNIAVSNINSSPVILDMFANVVGPTGSTNVGLLNQAASRPTITNSTVRSRGGAIARGIQNQDAASVLENVVLTVSGGSTGNQGILNIGTSGTSGSFTVPITNSKIIVSNAVARAVDNDVEFNVQIGSSQINAPISFDGGSVRCIGVYNATFQNPNGFTFCP